MPLFHLLCKSPETLLIAIGAAFGILYAVIAAIVTLRKTTAPAWLISLLLIGSITAILSGHSLSFRQAGAFNTVTIMTITAGIVLMAVGAMIWGIGQMQADKSTGKNYGVAGMTAALILIVAVSLSPLIYQLTSSLPIQVKGDKDLIERVALARTLIVSDNRLSVPAVRDGQAPSTNLSRSLGLSNNESPVIEPTITPTPFVFTLPTPVPAICNGTVMANLNFRDAPSLDSNRIDIIPQDTFLNVFNRDESGEWLEVAYDNRRGWVSASIVSLGEDCGL